MQSKSISFAGKALHFMINSSASPVAPGKAANTTGSNAISEVGTEYLEVGIELSDF